MAVFCRDDFILGSTPTGSKLKELFDKYLPLVEAPARNSTPIVIMVITDGVPSKASKVSNCSKELTIYFKRMKWRPLLPRPLVA
jgi:hypothetical protein